MTIDGEGRPLRLVLLAVLAELREPETTEQVVARVFAKTKRFRSISVASMLSVLASDGKVERTGERHARRWSIADYGRRMLERGV